MPAMGTDRLGPYVIDRELGSGGMGRVFRAQTTRPVGGLEPGCAVALKVIHAHLLESEGFFQRFLREADIGRSVAEGVGTPTPAEIQDDLDAAPVDDVVFLTEVPGTEDTGDKAWLGPRFRTGSEVMLG